MSRRDLLAGRELPELSAEEIRRYGRHLVLPEVGREGQRRLKASRVLVVGAGGLGSPLALYLAAAGVGTLGLVDFDTVDVTNLQRQVLYGTSDVGRPKLEAAAERLRGVNPHVELVLHRERLTSANALELFGGYDLVADGTDNFPTRYLVNDACVLAGVPNVYGSIFRFEGQVSVFWGAEGPCYRCLFREPPPPGLVPSCAEGGVLGVLPGVIGSLQANEALKLLLGKGEPAVGRLVTFDALRLRFREVRVPKHPECPVCSERPSQTELIDYEAFCGVEPEPERSPEVAVAAGASGSAERGRGEGERSESELPFQLGARELAAWLEEGRDLALLDVRTPMEWDIARIEGSTLIPLHELGGRIDEVEGEARGEGVDGERVVVSVCHHGIRSARATAMLRERGLRAVNLAGGIDAWSRDVDPDVPRY